MTTDPIADMFVRLQNSLRVDKKTTVLPYSQTKERLAKILKQEGFISDYQVSGEKTEKIIDIKLKYREKGIPALQGYRRVSKPGRRVYIKCEDIGPVRSGLGIAIVSTSAGVMVAPVAKKKGMGGELICELW